MHKSVVTLNEVMLLGRVRNDFTYHKPTEGQPEKYEAIRAKGLEVAEMLIHTCPSGRELSAALTKLDEVVFWADAAIARNK